ncbi:MAG: hypothetical protein AAF959_11635, partial [Cyanobacteria bacterium P01_D01_bin.56]
GTIHELAFLDKAMMDGRQLMSVRLLDLDIGKLTLDKPFAGTVAWIPEEEGIFYANREDAVREDSIVRPRRTAGTWANCKAFADLVAGDCVMDIVPTQSNQLGTYDPPLNAGDPTATPPLAANSISPKPVDMYADPDRRPYGFRLFNGYNLNRTDDDQAAGMTFVTDNPAYIFGDFNLHQDKTNVAVPPAAPNLVEEFKGAGELLEAGNFATIGEDAARDLFYERQDLDDRFARGDADTWRPAEVFADAVTILSSNFRDGWVEDTYIYATGGAEGAPAVPSSYLNYNRIEEGNAATDPIAIDADRWQRTDVATVQCTDASSSCDYPIRFDRNGLPKKYRPGDSTFYTHPEDVVEGEDFDDDFIYFADPSVADLKVLRKENQITPPDRTRVNALLVAGIVPLRQDQTYGGIQNFPRLIEYWANKSLIISGGFFQLNFSTQATAPQDQDAWEPGTVPIANQNYNIFYNPAVRIWGYDVGFQYTSVAPIAQRFVTLGRPRSEFYSELPLDDAYVQQLCTALQGVDNTVNCN